MLSYVVIKTYNSFPVGTIINAKSMDLQQYSVFTGSNTPTESNINGYLVFSNLPPMWINNDEFNENFKLIKDEKMEKVENMSIGEAIEALEAGKKVCRAGWNEAKMFLFLVPGSTFKVSRAPLLGIYPEGTEINYQPHIDMKTAQDTVVPWLASQSDILAKDWMIV